MIREIVRARRRPSARAAGVALIGLSIVTSWAWSADLARAGGATTDALTGAATFLLLGGGAALLWRPWSRGGRRVRVAGSGALVVCAAAALVAGVVPMVLTATTTGTVTVELTSTPTGAGYRLAAVARVTSDDLRQTSLEVTVHARDLAVPPMEATISFVDGTPDLTCASTRSVWTHEVSTVTLMCDDFAPASSGGSIGAIAVAES